MKNQKQIKNIIPEEDNKSFDSISDTPPGLHKENASSEKKKKTKSSKNKIDFTNFLQHANHPIVVFFTLFFKVLSAIIYLFFTQLVGESIGFIIIIISSAFDFWFVKNVSGRFLVGLRWWNEINIDGTEEWIYESENEYRESNIDSKIFWATIYAAPIFWGVFLVFNIISLSILWGMVCVISMLLSGSNMLGYLRCSTEQRKKIGEFITETATEGITNFVLGKDNNKV